MNNKQHLYARSSHFGVWLMTLCMMASVTVRFLEYSGDGLWLELVLPVAAGILFALTVLLLGEEMLYKTAVPVWIMGLCRGLAWRSPLGCAVCLCACVLYTCTVSGMTGRMWIPAYLLSAAGFLFVKGSLADLLMSAGTIVLVFSLRAHTDGKYHPSWGDRLEGRRVRTAPAMEQITAYFMPNRTGANNLFSTSVEITELENYVRGKRREGLKGFGLSHVIMAAYARTVAKYPGVNRFIAGQRIYSRGEDIALCMTVKKEMTAEAPDSLIKVHLNPRDTAEDVYRKFNAKVAEAKDEMENTTADNTADGFMRIPGLVLKFVVWLLKTMDYFGLVPAFLLEVSPFHGSVYFTSMGSLGIQPVYHHLYDFGTVPVFCSFGSKRKAQEIINGQIVERKYVDLKFNTDERICDGFYYANVIKYFQRLLRHPELLDEPPETVEQDIP